MKLLRRIFWSIPRYYLSELKDELEWLRDEPYDWWWEHRNFIWPHLWAKYFICPFKGHGDWRPDQCGLPEHDECGRCARVTRTHVPIEAKRIIDRYRKQRTKVWLEIEQHHDALCPRKDLGTPWVERDTKCTCWVAEVMKNDE